MRSVRLTAAINKHAGLSAQPLASYRLTTMATDTVPEDAKKVWTTLVTNSKYMPGVLTLNHMLKKVGSKYPLVVLYTDTFDEDGHRALDERHIYKQRIGYLLPTTHKDYTADSRFYDCWSKLQPFSLTQFERVVQLDSDMVVIQNMDELMDIPLDKEKRVFAASHACVCNPFKKPSYPANWVPDNCAYTHYFEYEYDQPWQGPPCKAGLGMCNGGLQVVLPDEANYKKILAALDSDATVDYEFSDQSLLSDVFADSWVPLSYKYNALKSLKWVHAPVWKDEEVKNIHYIITPKPWEVDENYDDTTGTFHYWWSANADRLEAEKKK